MAGILVNAAEFLDDLAHKFFPHPALPAGKPVCNLSDDTRRWNDAALEYSWRPGNGIVPAATREVPAEEMKRRQEDTYAWNRVVLGYSQ